MSIDLDAVKRRYTETVTVVDAFGRAIKVGRLKPSQQLKAGEMGANDSAAATIRVVCHVRAVDDKDLGFPETRQVLNSRLDMLEDEGLTAVIEGMKQIYGVEDDTPSKGVAESAKNSSASQVSDKPAG